MEMCVLQEVECETVAPGSDRVPRYPTTTKKKLRASKKRYFLVLDWRDIDETPVAGFSRTGLSSPLTDFTNTTAGVPPAHNTESSLQPSQDLAADDGREPRRV